MNDTLECTHGLFCKKFFHFEFVENHLLKEENAVKWDSDRKSMLYSHSKSLYVSFHSRVYDWNLDLSFLVAVLFGLWTVNTLANGVKIFLLRTFYHEELVCENGDTFMFAENKN